MNTKNVVIATIVGATLLGGCVFPIKAGSNEVAKVPSVNADVPFTLELPFLYSQKPLLLTNYVQKEGMGFLKPTTAIPNATLNAQDVSGQESAKEGTEDGFKGYDVPLNADLQKYAKQLCDKYGISYELIVATMKVESDFDPSMISPTNDYGIMQINRSNFSWLRKDLKDNFGVDNWKWNDPYHNILAGVWYYYTERQDLLKMGYSEEAISVSVLSYNMGSVKAKEYLKYHNAGDWAYVRKVMDVKRKLEKGENINDNGDQPKGITA